MIELDTTIVHVIPEMVDPQGKYWEQPKLTGVLVDDNHAILCEKDIAILKCYDSSTPSGVYVGKMWKRNINGKLHLCWYGFHEKPNTCSINYREIIAV